MNVKNLLIAGLLILSYGPTVAQNNSGSDMIKAAQQRADDRQQFRIVGGEPVSIEQRPWQVGLMLSGVTDDMFAQFCGGALAAPNWVVTAAHCVDSGTMPGQIQILFGTNRLNETGNRISVAEIIVHPNWAPGTMVNDVALVRLAGRISTQSSIQLSNVSNLDRASTLTVSGWGHLEQAGTKSEGLQAVTLRLQTNETCNAPDSYDGAVTNEMVCGGEIAGGLDSCQGDSGGPATVTANGETLLAGIVSWGEGCAQPKKYGVYARVPVLRSWILSNISNP